MEVSNTTSSPASEIVPNRTVDTDQTIAAHLRRRSTEHSRRLALGGGAWVLGTLGMLIAVDLLLDWSLDLPGYVRPLLLAVNLAVLACVAWYKLGRHRSSFTRIHLR